MTTNHSNEVNNRQWITQPLEPKEKSKFVRILNRLLLNPYVLISPALIACALVQLYPLGFTIYMSFFKWNILKGTKKFIGFDNYSFLFHDPEFLLVAKNTGIFIISTVFIGLALKVLIGIFLNKNTVRHTLVQTVIFTPTIIASTSIAVMFMWLMDPSTGIFNVVLEWFGGQPLRWYKSSDTSLLSIIIINIWSGIGYGVLYIIAGLRSVPGYIYEAATLDRAGKVKTFFKITLPLISPTLLYVLVTSMASAATSFDTVSLMTQGGPANSSNVLSYFIYQQGMQYLHYGRAFAASVMLLIINSTLAAISFAVSSRKVHYQ